MRSENARSSIRAPYDGDLRVPSNRCDTPEMFTQGALGGGELSPYGSFWRRRFVTRRLAWQTRDDRTLGPACRPTALDGGAA
jgi:hypothetical protein